MYGAPPRFAQAEQTGKAESTKDLTRCDNLGAPWAQDPRVSGVERWISSSRRGAEPITDGHLLSRGRRWHLAQHGCMKRTPYLHWGLHLGDPATRYRFRRPSLADECRSTADGPPPNIPAGEPVGEGRGGARPERWDAEGDWRAATAHAALPATRASVRARQGTAQREPATQRQNTSSKLQRGPAMAGDDGPSRKAWKSQNARTWMQHCCAPFGQEGAPTIPKSGGPRCCRRRKGAGRVLLEGLCRGPWHDERLG